MIGTPIVPAGASWCLQYPTGKDTSTLEVRFRRKVQGFITELETKHGCDVDIAATSRPWQRAWLMHWAWMVAREGTHPDDVPVEDSIPIAWTGPGAAEMVAHYAIVYEPSLYSRHIDYGDGSHAIDMKVKGWPKTNQELYDLGRSYGVIKLVSDPPHWSDDGR